MQAIKMNEKYWEYSNQESDNILGKFWFAAAPQKKEKGEHYSLATLRHIWYALKRLLYKNGKKVDILTHPDFLMQPESLRRKAMGLRSIPRK